jgi:peptide/nickel transport system permease protein
MLVSPHMVLVPGVALTAVVLAVNILGDCLRDRLDVKNMRRDGV